MTPLSALCAQKKSVFRLAGLGLILLVGFFSLGVVFWKTDRVMRENLVQTTRQVAALIAPELPRDIPEARPDKGPVEIGRLKEKLSVIHRAYPKYPFIFLKVRTRDGGLFFLTDPDPARSKASFSPRQAFSKVPGNDLDFLRAGQASVLGPVTDPWGTWLLGLAPIGKSETGPPLAILGLVIEADDWKRRVVLQSLEPGGLIATLFVCLILVHVRNLRRQRRQADEMLQALAVEWANLGTWDWTVPTGVIRFNKRLAEMLGYEDHELESDIASWKNRIHPDDRPGVEAKWNAHLEGKTERFESEHRLRHKSGSWFWILSRGKVVLRGPGGRPQRVCGINMDVSELKTAQEEIRRSQSSLAHAQAVAQVGNWDLDIQADRLSWSDEVYRICGLEKKTTELTSRSFLDTIHPDDRFEVLEAINAALYDQEEYDIEHRLVRTDGTIILVHQKGDVVLDETGQPLRMVGTIQDVTDRKMAEAKVVQAREAAEMYAQELRQTLDLSETMRQALEDELKVAADLQMSLLPPRDLKIPEVRVSWDFTPCEALGGDMIHVFRPDQDHLGAYILDVSGHGVASALLTFSIAQSLSLQGRIILEENPGRGSPDDRPVEPVRIMTRLDQEYPVERFEKTFSILFLVLNLKSGHLRYVNAGHPPALLHRSNGELEYLDQGGTLIGLGGILPFEQGETVLGSGDRLLLYTDGVTECPDPSGALFGQEQLDTLFRASQELPLDQAVHSLSQALEDYGEWMPPPDDVTFLALEYCPDSC